MNIQKLHRSLTRRYILGLGLVAVLSTLAFAMVRSVIATHEFSAQIINLSGRQRMLSQRLELLAERSQTLGTPAAKAAVLSELKTALQEFSAAHRTLTRGNGQLSLDVVQSPVIRSLFFAGPQPLNTLVLNYIHAMESLQTATTTIQAQTALQTIRSLSGADLLARLNGVVAQYQKESDAEVVQLQRVEALIWLVTLALLIAEVRFIFRPLAKTILELFNGLSEAREVALRATDAKSSFLATITHEIRTPMIGVQGIANLLLESDLSSLQRDRIGAVKRMSDSLILLVNDILDLSKIEAGKLTIETTDFDLHTFMKDAAQLFQANSEQKGIKLAFEIDPRLPLMRRGDPLRLGQVLTNFVGNALKFTPKGGAITVTMAPAPEAGEYGLRVAVRDSGIGMTPEQQAGLFRRYNQAEPSTARQYGGTGLGLSIAKQIIELMQGAIGCDSQSGHGSTFWFTLALPLSQLVALETTVSNPAGYSPSGEWAGLRALLAEDNPVNQMIATAALKKLGFTVVAVDNGQAAVDVVSRGEEFSVVFMDCEMPILDGFAATQAIRGLASRPEQRSLAIIAMTAHLADSVRDACLAAGMDGFLTKPLNLADVATCLRRLLGKDRKPAHIPSRAA